MSDFAAVSIFFFLIAVTLFFAVLIGRKLFKTGVEHFSGRMLILFGILNVFLCTLVLFSQTISHSPIPMPGRLFTGFLTIFIPARVLWNYLTLPKKIISRFNLKPDSNETVIATIASISKSMEIMSPVILSSDSVRTPFVFGRRSARPYLAIPKQWNTSGRSGSYSVFLHEMAHIRNHDIGFLAWSQAYTKDFKWLLIFFPAMILIAYLSHYQQIASSLWIYLSCLFTLYGLLKYILRKREHLADKTVALLVETSHVERAISRQPAVNLNQHVRLIQRHKADLGDVLHQWLTDKAIFSKHPKRWGLILRAFTFFRLSHPDRLQRINSILSTNKNTASHQVTTGESFWAGLTLGFLGVAIGLCGYWISGPIQYDPEDTNCLLLSYTLYGLATSPAVGFWVIFITLPFWASLSNPNLDKIFFRSLLKRHGIAFAGACVISLLILTVSMTQLHLKILFVLCILWQLLIVLIGFCVSIVSVFMWNIARYLQASTVKNLRKSLWILIPLLIIALGATFLGMFWISNHRVFEGANLIFSTLIGCVIFKEVMGRSRFSEPDHYMTLALKLFTCQIEGKSFLQWNKLIDIAVIPLFLLFPMLLLYGCLWWLFHDTLGDLSVRWSILSLIIIGCIILVLIQLSERGKARITRRPKIHRLFHSLKLLSKPQSTENLNKVAQVAKSYGLKDRKVLNRPANLTTGDIYEIYHLTKDTYPELSKRAIEWTLQCQQSGGFGLWPQSGPRLISTWQVLSIFKDSNRLDAVNPSEHVSWIKSLQQPDGSFKGPWSKRNTWEDTFFAVQSLNILQASLETGQAEQCHRWCHRILLDGIAKDRADMVYYSVGSLNALNCLDEDTKYTISDWLSEKTEKLLLANIGLNYENVHFSVMTYDILNQSTPLLSMAPQIQLLTNRIQTALDAELEDIRI